MNVQIIECKHALDRAIDLIQRRHLAIVQDGLIHPPPFNGTYLNCGTLNVVKPEWNAEAISDSLRWCIKMTTHPTLNTLGRQSNIQNLIVIRR